MHKNMKGALVGSLAIVGVMSAAADVQAMTIQPLSPAASTSGVEKVWWRGGYGYAWHRPFYRWHRPYYGYAWRRPFYPHGGFVYGWRRPHYGWRRW